MSGGIRQENFTLCLLIPTYALNQTLFTIRESLTEYWIYINTSGIFYLYRGEESL